MIRGDAPATGSPGDVGHLLRVDPRLGVPVPRYDGASIANIAPTIVRSCLGDVDWGDPPLSPPLLPDLDPLSGRRAQGPVLVLLIDGMGWSTLDGWATHVGSPTARIWRGMAHPITSVFPTTTTAALASLSSGVPPGRHGLVGYRQFLPRFGVVADMLKMSPIGLATHDLLVGPHWRPSDVSGAPTVFRRGLPASVVSRDRFAGSGFTRVLYDWAEFVPYATMADMAHELARVLDSERPPGVVYAYWDELDTIQHLRGGAPSSLSGFELERVAQLMGYVRAHVSPARRRATTVFVTGDHGQVPATPAARIPLETHPEVVRELAHPPAGDRRAGFLAARPGRGAALRSALEAILPPASRVLAMDDAVAVGLFGPPPFHPEIAARLGDLLVLVPAPGALTYLIPGAPTPSRYLVGAHGGLDPDELLVPLIAGALDDFAAPPPEPSSPQR